ncbi:MAG: PKD domain-containing protein [Bacteroidota bacterium]
MKNNLLFYTLTALAFWFIVLNTSWAQPYENIDITVNSAYLPNTPGYNFEEKFERHNSGVVGTNGGTEMSNDIQALAGGDVWKSWIDIGSSAYRAEVEALFYKWDNYETYYENPDGNTWTYQFIVSRPTNYVPSDFKVPGTLQKYGLLKLISQAHDWDRDVNKVYGVNGVTPPWSLAVADGAGGKLMMYEKLLNGLGQSSDPLIILEDNINARWAAGHRLQVMWRISWTKANDGFVDLYTCWHDPANPQETDFQLKYHYEGPTLHPNNVDWTGYVRTGIYYSDHRFYGSQIATDGSGALDQGKRREIWYFENPTWLDQEHHPEYDNETPVEEIMELYKYVPKSAANETPEADFSHVRQGNDIPAVVEFDATNSSDSDGSIVNYEWDFGDGSTGTGMSAEHTFTSAGDFSVSLTVTDNGGAQSTVDATITVEEEPCEVAEGWSTTDVGSVGVLGSTCEENGQITMNGSGEYLFYEQDGFHFRYQEVTGNIDVRVRVTQLTYTHHWAKAGIMLRQNLTGGSPHVMVGVSPVSWYFSQSRDAQDGEARDITSFPTTVALPHWVRLVRDGSYFTTYESTDGINWQVIEAIAVPLSQTVYVGLAVSARDNSQTTQAIMDNFSITNVGGASSLPVELTDFIVEPEPVRGRVELRWETATELNNSHFIVQRSADGVMFADILEVDGAGTTTSNSSYQAFDSNPIDGQSHYRLKQVDFDGQISFSQVKTTQFQSNFLLDLLVSPNPSSIGQDIQVSFALPVSRSVHVTLYDTQGKEVWREASIQVGENGKGFTKIPTPRLMPGIYFVRVIGIQEPSEIISKQILIK